MKTSFRQFGSIRAKALIHLACGLAFYFCFPRVNTVFAQQASEQSKDEIRLAKEVEDQAKTLFGEWERISADTDIGFSHEQVFGKGERIAPKRFFLGDPNPGMFILYWSWHKFDGRLDHHARLAVEPPKGLFPRPFRVQTGYTTIIFHVLSTENKAELWVVNPKITDAVYQKGEGKIEPVFAGYYSQKDAVNRWSWEAEK